MRSAQRAEPTVGSERFQTLARLGAGGNGVVYRALDRVLDSEVAIKILTRNSGRDLFRFKREFRALSEILHPNLVRLYELFVLDDQWFFSMELVDGVPLSRYLRAAQPDPPTDDLGVSPFDATADTTEVRAPRPLARHGAGRAAGDLDRLRAGFCQLADAVTAIHALGKVHRDLKPSNVLVAPDGRVVVLDYGLVSDTQTMTVERTHEAAAVGTPAYMSPEQASDRPLSAATDWYSVGVMLYQALTGIRPFEGPPLEMLQRRAGEEPAPPRSLVPTTPAALDALTMALLRRDPATRADGREILRVLGGAPSAATLAVKQLATSHQFVGRRRELGALHDALRLARAGQSVVVPVTGPSGIGKTTLLGHFLDSLDPDEVLAFHGRCYERETMPYQAMDSLIDAVTSRLLAASSDEVEVLLPRDIAALTRLFPILNRVPAIAAPRLRPALPPDRAELRRRAVAAIGELLANLAGSRTRVVFLDDLQWSDADSGAIVAELIHQLEDAGALFIVASRTADEVNFNEPPEVSRGATLRLGAATAPSPSWSVMVRELAVGPMSADDASELVQAMLATTPESSSAAAIVREAGGVPIFLAELARHDRVGGDVAPSLERLIDDRVAGLPALARALLEVCAISTRPLRLEVAARVTGGDVAAALSVLRTERLVHVDRRDGHSLLEPAHDRVRISAVAALAEGRARELHASLAAAMEGRPETIATDLVGHWLAAGATDKAALHARGAAVTAEESLAFHRAADLYRLAVGAPGLAVAERRALQLRLAECMANVGRLDAAIAALDEASGEHGGDLPAEERREIKRLEIEYALRLGDHDRGLNDARALLAELGYRIPLSSSGTVASVAWHGLRLRVRGLEFTPVATLAPADRERIDLLWSLTSGLVYVNPGVGRLTQLHHLHAALRGGDPVRVVRALSLELGTLAQDGPTAQARVASAAARCRELIRGPDRPDLQGLYEVSHGVACAIMGQWSEALDHTVTAERLLRDHCSGMRWALAMAQFYRVTACWCLGDTREVVRLVPRYVAEAMELGDAHALGGMRTGRGSVYWLLVDRPAEGRAMAAAGLPRRNPDDTFHLHDYFHALADAQLDLYEGEAGHAIERVEPIWAPFHGSLLRRVQFVRLDITLLRARCALAAAAADRDRARLLELARRGCDDVDRAQAPWARPIATLLRAGMANVRGDQSLALEHLERAAQDATAQGMSLYARAARYRLGQCRGGDEGEAIVDEISAQLRDGEVADPAALMRVLAPGW